MMRERFLEHPFHVGGLPVKHSGLDVVGPRHHRHVFTSFHVQGTVDLQSSRQPRQHRSQGAIRGAQFPATSVVNVLYHSRGVAKFWIDGGHTHQQCRNVPPLSFGHALHQRKHDEQTQPVEVASVEVPRTIEVAQNRPVVEPDAFPQHGFLALSEVVAAQDCLREFLKRAPRFWRFGDGIVVTVQTGPLNMVEILGVRQQGVPLSR